MENNISPGGGLNPPTQPPQPPQNEQGETPVETSAQPAAPAGQPAGPQPVMPNTAPNMAAVQPTPKNRKKLLIVALSAVGVLVLGLLFYFFFMGSSGYSSLSSTSGNFLLAGETVGFTVDIPEQLTESTPQALENAAVFVDEAGEDSATDPVRFWIIGERVVEGQYSHDGTEGALAAGEPLDAFSLLIVRYLEAETVVFGTPDVEYQTAFGDAYMIPFSFDTTDEGTVLGNFVFLWDEDTNTGYTLILGAFEDTWNGNASTWTEILSSFSVS